MIGRSNQSGRYDALGAQQRRGQSAIGRLQQLAAQARGLIPGSRPKRVFGSSKRRP